MSDSRSDTVTVRIYDREYTLRTSDDARNLLELCRELDRRMREYAQASGSVDTLKVAILTALGLTDELERAREALRKMDDAVSRRSIECVSMLDRFLY
jgi:cell division protein ZapA